MLAASWHYLPRVDGTVYGLRDDRHPQSLRCPPLLNLRILLLHIADDGLSTIAHVDMLDADNLLSPIAQPSKYLDLGCVSPH